MAVDTATTIAAFDTSKPAGADARAELDDSVRHVKTVIQSNLAYIGGTVTASHTELSYVKNVTSPIQTQLDLKAPLASPTLTGTPLAPTAAIGTSTTQVATTAFVATAIAGVNASTGTVTRSYTSSTSFSVASGQVIACTSASAWAATAPASPSSNAVFGVASQNGLATNSIDFGANGLVGANGTVVTGVVTLDVVKPGYFFAWYGDYWREA
jgi:hypothetical protein